MHATISQTRKREIKQIYLNKSWLKNKRTTVNCIHNVKADVVHKSTNVFHLQI